MKQTPVRIGWPIRFELGWAVVPVLSTAFLTGAITGCGGGVNSAEYEAIVDQPEDLPSVPDKPISKSPKVDVASIESTGADQTSVESETPATSNSNADPDQPPKAELASGGPETGSATTPSTSDNGEPALEQETGDSQTGGSTTAAKPGENSVALAEGSNSEKPANSDVETAVKKVEEKEAKKPRVVKLLIPNKEFKTEGKGSDKALRVSFDDFDLLKVLNMDPVTEDAPSKMPRWLKDLDGKRIRVRGFMFPPFEEENIRAFTLARDNQICCFGRNPLVYDLVDIFMRKGVSTDYIQNRPFDVIGTFHIGDSIVPGQLYSMDDAVVIDK